MSRLLEAPPIKYPYVGGTKWAFFKWADIPDGHDETVTYLRRLRILQTPLFSIYLHFIYLPDRDRDPHDHPWNFASLVLRGGYTEDVWDQPATRTKYHRGESVVRSRRHGWLSFRYLPLRKAHGIRTIDPGTVTLVFTGRKKRDWGFWTQEGFVGWQTYNRAKYGPDPGPDEFA